MLNRMATDETVRLVADRLRAIAERLGRELGEDNDTKVAIEMGIGQSVLWKLQNEPDRGASLDTMCQVMKRLEISPLYFFDTNAAEPVDFHAYKLERLRASEPTATAETDPRIRASLEKYRPVLGLTDEELAIAPHVVFGWDVPDEADWMSWRDHRRRAKREGRADLSEKDIARTARAAASGSRKSPPRR